MDLDVAVKTMRQVRLEAAAAQNLLRDDGFLGFLSELKRISTDIALYESDPAHREIGRAQVLFVNQLVDWIEQAASRPQRDREATALAAMHE